MCLSLTLMESLRQQMPLRRIISMNENVMISFWTFRLERRLQSSFLLEFSVYQCGRCSESFATGRELKNHLDMMNKTKYSDQLKYFECFICKRFRTKDETAMRDHIKQHPYMKIPKCEICNTQTAPISHLCGKNKIVQCEYCPEKLMTTEKLLEHLNSMHKSNRRLYGCEKCPKYFPMVFLKDCHQMSHSERNPKVKCDMCLKTFTTKGSLTTHKETHSSKENCKIEPHCHPFHQVVEKFDLNLLLFLQHFCATNAARDFLRLKSYAITKASMPDRPYSAPHVQRNFSIHSL